MFPDLANFNLQLFFTTRKNLIAAAALALTGVILIFLAFGQIGGALDTRQTLSTEQAKIRQLNTKAQELEQLKFSPEFAQAEEINRVLPSHKPLLELLNNLNNVAGESGVSITEFEVSPGEIASDSTQVSETDAPVRRRNTDYDQLDLELTIVGELGQVKNFMELIERVSPLTTITSLTIDRRIQNQQQALSANDATRADLALSTHYYTKSISSTLASPLPDISNAERTVFQEILDFTPPQLEEQTTIITGSNTDLFGIGGLNVRDLENAIEESGGE
jgi:Tfp pilus assembly protein PilO